MKLIFCGGVSGVGKTTLLYGLKKRFGKKIQIINPGELFRRYFYNRKIKTLSEIEELIVQKINRAPTKSIIILHWHYAVHRPSEYIPQISFPRLRQLTANGKIDQIVLLLIEAPTHTIQERRRLDYKSKKRRLQRLVIQEELEMEQKFWRRHRRLFSKKLGKGRVVSRRLSNLELTIARANFEEIISSFLLSEI